MKSVFMTHCLWGAYPYICLTLFLVVPVIRMIYRPFGFSTRASGLFNRDALGVASLFFHWGILLVFLAHLAGFIGGLLGWEGWIAFFRWAGLIGGFATLIGSIVALARRLAIPEVKAMSQWDDYLIHAFLVVLLGLGLYQVVVDRIFGVAYTASSWLASVVRFAPQPELMASATLISKWHIVLALTFFALFPFTKLVHFWTFPVNYFVRPYQAMRTGRYLFQRRWEFALRSDKSFLLYSLAAVVVFFGAASLLLGRGRAGVLATLPVWTPGGRLAGTPLYVSQCARCHGLHGNGKGPGARSPTFAAPPRDFTAANYSFISTANSVASDQDLARTIHHGLVPAGMPAFAGLDDRQVASLVSILRAFQRDSRVEAGQEIEVPPLPPTATAQRGRELFQMACAPCHGEGGRGDGPNVAMLKDAQGRPLRPRDLTQGPFKAGSEPEQVYLRIAAGIPPAMPEFRSSLEPQDIWSVIKFIESEFLSGKGVRRGTASAPKPPATVTRSPASSPDTDEAASEFE